MLSSVFPMCLRCIPCKGSVFPATLPRPAVAILPFKLPFCQTSTEKGQMEVCVCVLFVFNIRCSLLCSVWEGGAIKEVSCNTGLHLSGRCGQVSRYRSRLRHRRSGPREVTRETVISVLVQR